MFGSGWPRTVGRRLSLTGFGIRTVVATKPTPMEGSPGELTAKVAKTPRPEAANLQSGIQDVSGRLLAVSPQSSRLARVAAVIGAGSLTATCHLATGIRPWARTRLTRRKALATRSRTPASLNHIHGITLTGIGFRRIGEVEFVQKLSF